MSFWHDVAQTYVRPATVARRLNARHIADRVLLAYVMGASLISFAARMPGMIRDYQPTPDAPLAAFAASTMVAALIFAPLFFYALASLSDLAMRLIGRASSGVAARLALFWPLFALQPLVIALQIVSIWQIPALILSAIHLLAGAYFLFIWLSSLTAVTQKLPKV